MRRVVVLNLDAGYTSLTRHGVNDDGLGIYYVHENGSDDIERVIGSNASSIDIVYDGNGLGSYDGTLFTVANNRISRYRLSDGNRMQSSAITPVHTYTKIAVNSVAMLGVTSTGYTIVPFDTLQAETITTQANIVGVDASATAFYILLSNGTIQVIEDIITSSTAAGWLRYGILTSSAALGWLRIAPLVRSLRAGWRRFRPNTTSLRAGWRRFRPSTTSLRAAWLRYGILTSSTALAWLRHGIVLTIMHGIGWLRFAPISTSTSVGWLRLRFFSARLSRFGWLRYAPLATAATRMGWRRFGAIAGSTRVGMAKVRAAAIGRGHDDRVAAVQEGGRGRHGKDRVAAVWDQDGRHKVWMEQARGCDDRQGPVRVAAVRGGGRGDRQGRVAPVRRGDEAAAARVEPACAVAGAAADGVQGAAGAQTKGIT